MIGGTLVMLIAGTMLALNHIPYLEKLRMNTPKNITEIYATLTRAWQAPGRSNRARFPRGRGYNPVAGPKRTTPMKIKRPVGSNGGQGGRKGGR